MSFIESMGIACSDSISHNRVQVLSIPVLLLTCSQDWTCNLQEIIIWRLLREPTPITVTLIISCQLILLPWMNIIKMAMTNHFKHYKTFIIHLFLCNCFFRVFPHHTHTHTIVFANGPGDQGSIPGQIIPKTKKIVLDATLFSTQHYKVRIKGKWSNPGNGVAPSLHHSVVAIEREPSGCPQLRLPTLLIWYQVFYLIQTICKLINLTHRWNPNEYYPLGQSGAGSNINKKMTAYTQEFQNWSFTDGCSLMSYLEIPLGGGYGWCTLSSNQPGGLILDGHPIK